ncbi:MAG: DUF4340 domain-containing protein [Lachnospiraceae bacterium]|nr:DUF4340 domain-containing protein [Lachnospiraceae bacterium]
MKKKNRNLIILVAALIVLCAAYLIIRFAGNKDKEETAEEKNIMLSDFQKEEIKAFYVYAQDYELSFKRSGDTFVNIEDAAFPVNMTKINSMLDTLVSLDYHTFISKDMSLLSEYGIDRNGKRVVVDLNNGKTRSFVVGDLLLLDKSSIYLLDVENEIIVACQYALNTQIMAGKSSFIEKEEVISLDENQIKRIDILTNEKNYSLVKQKSALDAIDEILKESMESGSEELINIDIVDEWTVTDSFDGQNTVNQCDLEALEKDLWNYTTYTTSFTIEYNCKDFAQYGLDNPWATLIVFFNEKDEDGKLTDKLSSYKLTVGNKDEAGDYYYIRINDSSYVYKMTNALVENRFGKQAIDYIKLK